MTVLLGKSKNLQQRQRLSISTLLEKAKPLHISEWTDEINRLKMEYPIDMEKSGLTPQMVIEFIIDREINVMPIVPPGNSLSDMILESEERTDLKVFGITMIDYDGSTPNQ